MKTNDNATRLKTYKIKNHNSGQTYRVKAVSYTDAKMKYNAHILKDSITEDDFDYDIMYKISDYIDRNEDKVERMSAKQIFDFVKKQFSNISNTKIAESLEYVYQGSRLKFAQFKDSITEDAYVYPTHASTNMAASFAKLCVEKFGGKVGSKGGNKYVYIAQDKETANKAKRFLEETYKTSLPTVGFIVGDSITEDAYVYPTHASTNMAASFAKLCVEKFGGKVGSKGGNKYVYIAQDKETANKAKRFLEETYKTSLPTVGFIVGDSITEDAVAKIMWPIQYGDFENAKRDAQKAGLTATLVRKNKHDLIIKFSGAEDKLQAFVDEYGLTEDSITEDAQYEEGFSSTKGELVLVVHESIAQHLKRKFGGSTSSQKVYGQKQSYWTTTNKSVYESAKKYLSNEFKDSITEDASFSNWLDKTAVLEVKPQIDAALSSFKKGGHSGTKYDDYSIYLFASFGPDKFELRYYYSTLLEKAVPSVINDKTSIVSDLLAKFNRITGANAKLEKTGRLTSRGKTEFLAKAESTGKSVSGNEYVGYTPRAVELMFKKEKIDSIFKDSLTEDADIAQNDIKSSYLPEDANADNIQYLGFNEKRKLSFYSYGDRYFVHYDLEGRTEEIDKETVQKILKKNILGEIDENYLINKEPQSEEIVSDSFEDAGEITLEQFNPKRLVESSKSRKQALHNEIKMKNGDVYTVFFQASGEVEKPRSIWVSIVLEKPSGQQSRVLTEEAETYEQAIQIMNDWKKKQERGDR